MLSLWIPWPVSPWWVVLLGILAGIAGVLAVAALAWRQVEPWESFACPSSSANQATLSWRRDAVWGGCVGTVLALACFVQFGACAAMFAALAFVVALLALGWIDWRRGYLPDVVTQPLLWLGLLVNLNDGFVTLPQAVLGAVCGYLAFWSVAWVFLRLSGREGLGHGDFKLLAAMGAWLGVAALPLLLLVAAASALLMVLCWRVLGKVQAGQAISFGPFLALAGIWYLLWPYAL